MQNYGSFDIILSMNLFFDLECANCYNHVAKICEFGYVLTDDKLNIIAKENLIVNPMSPFNTYGFKTLKIQHWVLFAQ